MTDMDYRRWQQQMFVVMLLIAFLILAARLVDVSIIRGRYFQRLAEGNRVRVIPIHAPRGNILDRTGVTLAESEQTKSVLRFEAGKPVAFLEKEKVDNPENEVAVPRWVRKYPKGAAAAHVVGYLGEATKEEVGKSGCLGSIYGFGDFIGRLGVEAAFDCLLRGKDGEELVEVDTKGNKVRVLGRREPKSGKNVKLSIDWGIQQAGVNALGDQKGAVVALSPRTGEILALVSSPSFSPETISQDFPQLTTNNQLPLLNRAIGGAYPPGSTFKIVTAAAGLEEGKISEETRFVDPGVITVSTFKYANWYFTQYGKTEGEIDLVRAITRSTDTFFYKVGEWVGVENLSKWAKNFGLGGKTGIELSGEVGGMVPSPEWKERNRGERWFLGNTYHMSIGQGDVAATPLQIAVMTAVIASGGKLCTPHVSTNGALQNFQFPISQCKEVGLSQKTIDLILRGMVGACSPGGTTFPLFNFKVSVACKTGTAEFGDPKDRTHAWLTAFAPSENPGIVITAFVEGGGEGSSVAAPVVKEVLEEWFGR